MNFKKLALTAGILFAAALSLPANTVYQYSFGNLGNLGSSSHTFAPVNGPSSLSITAAGYHGLGSWNLSSVNLYSKGSAFDFSHPGNNGESGLGLVNDRSGDHEITAGNFIVLDLGNLSNLVLSSIGVYTESTTGNEHWAIWGSNSNTPGTDWLQRYVVPGNALTDNSPSHSDQGLQDVSNFSNSRYLFVTSTNGNVLLGAFSATDPASATPEPASAALLGIALLCVGTLSRRLKLRRKA